MSTLTLEQMYEMQKALDAKIIVEKGLEGKDLLPNTVLALQVEIAELANEWRGFKHWSNDRQKRTKKEITCSYCNGTGDENSEANIQNLLDGGSGEPYKKCSECDGKGMTGYSNPLLEEYVDCLHFFLSIARQLDLPASDLYSWEDGVEGETTILFSEIMHNVGMIHADKMLTRDFEDVQAFKRECFRAALFIFHALGEQRLGFTFEDVSAAYAAKNAVNHERQANGY
ncbi:Dimeric dUTPase, all-alpha-NTP-PPase (MazG) superfamily [Paenibacillus algorifonticola]|uniref:Dimeric dUTPase, all-alpha-NTP-PPase (MazG) superfamily n=1 Tax=Paenibacillus algorifonticola TaxID=684063 RepID=A0A1I2AEJ8_9BACL|nr:dUTP diphosphatase [Paenibacillus algorifonticola]SFE42336.1 Dimeric dUTPase, all-alpha-NTP-PPase (MazG) superfamily [Paenibacillus algorifonticola]